MSEQRGSAASTVMFGGFPIRDWYNRVVHLRDTDGMKGSGTTVLKGVNPRGDQVLITAPGGREEWVPITRIKPNWAKNPDLSARRTGAKEPDEEGEETDAVATLGPTTGPLLAATPNPNAAADALRRQIEDIDANLNRLLSKRVEFTIREALEGDTVEMLGHLGVLFDRARVLREQLDGLNERLQELEMAKDDFEKAQTGIARFLKDA